MTEHEAGPLDDRPVALHLAVSALQRKRAFRRELAKAEPQIRSGVCGHCGAFGSLWHQTDSCAECFKEHEAPQAVTFVDKSLSPADAVAYADRRGWTVTEKPKAEPNPYWTGFTHGFVVALVVVLGMTGLLLWSYQ